MLLAVRSQQSEHLSAVPLNSSHKLFLPLGLGLDDGVFLLQQGSVLLQGFLQLGYSVVQCLLLPLHFLQLRRHNTDGDEYSNATTQQGLNTLHTLQT